jgi:hypothetical protein
MKIIDLGQAIYDEIGDTTNISLPSIITYLRNNVGRLNALLNTTYIIDPNSLEIINGSDNITLIGLMESAIYAQLYEVYYFQRRANAMLGAASIDTVIQYQTDGGSIRLLDRNQIAKTYAQLKKEAEDILYKMVNRYKFYTTQAVQIVGEDIIEPPFPLNYARRNLLT